MAVDPTASYRVTVNNFLAAGGDGFTRLTAGTNLFTGGVDLDAFVNYITAQFSRGARTNEPDHDAPISTENRTEECNKLSEKARVRLI